ncbi:putative pyruvate, phosphate dikinase regulatory protein [Beijerinckiaceae bacterium RH AL1]|nr:kinase/pyrophosphorylase [Beijerinckiaceae bacterium]VVB50108.1 putative pyruvate, phosphate dikinase regulatory protein [Beijerinckiaceae bacterium RH CH11]VVB50160.1 putative pyruvate, phosphate dikinase regulatory protein [Beijerinckiaceae bacterium RH AL8]VVC57242.1 putative pyruvate, phosphate dikinase regulatory protein [Beijerinckiaceae bacterium RH AL1]
MRRNFHLHLISDSTGETLMSVSRAAAAQYEGVSAIEHIYPLVRSLEQLDKAIAEIEAAPGIVLYTLVDSELIDRLEAACRDAGAPTFSVLGPILNFFEAFIGVQATPRPGAQHILDADYYRRIDALNYSMMCDDGQNVDAYEEADVVLVGISRTSKTPTSIYLANRGVKTANIPMVPRVLLPRAVRTLVRPLVVGLIATPDRIVQIRQNRLIAMNDMANVDYVDKKLVAEEIAFSRRYFEQQGWPVIDVTRRSIEETAASVMDLMRAHRYKSIALDPTL